MPANAQFDLLTEKILDSFAGGGGTSTGIELATGRIVDFAINHDPAAILMHKTNHPRTAHYQASVWDVWPDDVLHGSKLGLAWFSPDCKHFSKAKGAALVDRKIRGLAWIVLRWAALARPRVIIVENVEEFPTWGPVRKGKPVKKKAGQTFEKWKKQLSDLGYEIEYRELVAADYGAPTIRKRFFLIARCDGKPIVWPERTHAPADSEEVKSGKCKPWKTAAEIIDWSQPMYSVFESKQEIKKKYGARVVRPLADNTMRRVIRGTDKFTIRSGKPFLVECNHSGGGHIAEAGKPLGTITAKCTKGVCTAQLMSIGQTGGVDRIRSVEDPTPTAVSKAETCLVNAALSPVTVSNTSGSVGFPADKPIHTVTTDGKQILHAAHLAQYHTERTEAVRGQGLGAPLQTVDASNRYSLISASLSKFYGGVVGADMESPLPTVTGIDHNALLAANLVEYFSTGRPIDLTDPMHTVTSRPREALTAAHVVEFKGQDLGQALTYPLRTITTSAGEFAICKAVIAQVEPGEDLGHWPEIRALLNKYCGYHLTENEIVLLIIAGAVYYIRDILLRMLTPRELYNAMGFPADYIIDRDYMGNEYKKDKQVARCGNAVPPPFATALIRANFPEWCKKKRITTMEEFERAVAV